jgi:NifU-like protein involved in Fe-S cluster formation
MPPSRPAKLYSPALLGLATGLAQFPLDAALPLRAEARSRTCGSTIIIAMATSDAGLICGIGLQASACAIGQASAALLAQSAIGADPAAVHQTTQALSEWLAGTGDLPDWPGIAALVPARDHPGRHGALLLPWTAACMALSSTATCG